METLTKRQREVFEFLRAYARRKGYPPTVREIRDEFHLQSNRGVIDHLRALERKGWIKRQRGISRAIEIVEGAGDTHRAEGFAREGADTGVVYPVAGKIAAGRPSPPVEESGERLVLDRSLFGAGEDGFILEVRGDSMVDDHIVPGDLLVVKRQTTCEPGEIVVALVNGEATVKRYVCGKEGAMLKPGNPQYAPIRLSDSKSNGGELVGTVVGVIRRIAGRRRPFSR